MSYHELLLMIRRFRWLYLLLLIITFISSTYFLRPRILTYRGVSTFYLANDNLSAPTSFLQKGQEEGMHIMFLKERVTQLIYSHQMLNHLITKFDLYKHYGIDSTKQYHYEKMLRKLAVVIGFNKVTPDIFQISVIDKDNFVAADMTNEVVKKLEELNQKYIYDKIQANLNFFDTYLQTSVVTGEEQNKKLFDYIEILNQQKLQPGKFNTSAMTLSQIEFSIYQAASKIEEVTTQLISARNMYEKALELRRSNELPFIIVLKKALPEMNSKHQLLLFISGLAALLSVATLIIFMFLFFHFRTDLQIVFGAKLPNKVPKHW